MRVDRGDYWLRGDTTLTQRLKYCQARIFRSCSSLMIMQGNLSAEAPARKVDFILSIMLNASLLIVVSQLLPNERGDSK